MSDDLTTRIAARLGKIAPASDGAHGSHLRAVVDSVLETHHALDGRCVHCDWPDGRTLTTGWPCPTVRNMSMALGVGL